jgi:hypothetical protein
MLSAEQKRLYVRHALLAEIGEAGQERLCRTHAAFPPGAASRAAEVAREYLTRAGVLAGGGSDAADSAIAITVAVADASAVERVAGGALLADAAATLAGAFAAVEALKAVVGAGTPAPFPGDLTLAEDPA